MRRAWRRIRGSGSRSAGNVPPSEQNAPAASSSTATEQPHLPATGGRRSTVPRRRRIGRTGDFAVLDPHIDQNLGPDKELVNFRILPGEEVHTSTSVEASVSIFNLLSITTNS